MKGVLHGLLQLILLMAACKDVMKISDLGHVTEFQLVKLFTYDISVHFHEELQ